MIVAVFTLAMLGSIGMTTVPAAFAQEGPTIDVWYGLNQTFGLPGEPQIWCDIPGNVSDPDGVASLSYTLNGGPAVNLTIGPNSNRLINAGDFLIDLLVDDLQTGANTIAITAVDGNSNPRVQNVTLNYSAGNSWPTTYSTDWGSLVVDGNPSTPDPAILEQGHVIDGKWSVDGGAIRTVEAGYDRLIGFGDLSWQEYEVTVPITLHEILNVNSFGVGFLFRWNGHTDDPINCAQPHCGWIPLGDIGWLINGKLSLWQDNNDVPFPIDLETVYWLKMRVETLATGVQYSLKAWEDGEAEPAYMVFSDPDGTNYPPSGSLLLIAHRVDVSFGDVSIVPITGPNVAPVANVDAVNTNFNGTSYFDILDNDTDSDGVIDPSTITIVNPPDYGVVTDIDPLTGIVTYQHSGAGPALDMFRYRVRDNDGALSNRAWVNITIVPNQPPVANDDDANVPFNFAADIDVILNDTDSDGVIDPTTVTIVNLPAYGTASADPVSGTVTYTHNGIDEGPDSFTYSVRDDSGDLSNTATVSVTIGPEPPEDFFSDDFNSCDLDPLWTFVNPQYDESTATITGAFTGDAQLAISVPGGSNHEPWDGFLGAPYIFQPAKDKDFTLEVKFSSTLPATSYAEQGILVIQDSLKWLRFDFNSTETAIRVFGTSEDGSPSIPLMDVGTPGDAPLYLRVQRSENFWYMYYSLDGSSWTLAGTMTYTMTVTNVGVFAGNAGGSSAPAFTSYIDYFSNSVDPIVEPDDQEQNSLFVTVSGGGSVVKNPNQAVYACGTPVQLTANADPDWVFAGWSDDLSGTNNPTTITMDRPRFVTANFVPTSGTVVSANTSGVPGISSSNPCASGIPVEILRDSGVDIRDFTVTIQLTNLDLCDGLASFTEGDFLSNIGETSFDVVNNGNGSYDIEVAILGTPCGATALTGTLFTLDVTNTIPAGTGTIDVSDVQMHNCSGIPVAAAAGGPASIVIDTTSPTGVSNLSFSKVMTGNLAGNVTAVDLSWTPSSDPGVVRVLVYRKGFGPYPEYSDAGGSVPALPTNPVGQGWELVTSVLVGTNSTTDLASTRNYWYYCAQAVDDVGNPSAAVMTGGVLNYLLGDVSDGGDPLQDGNNVVWAEDFTRLGAHYGTQNGDGLYLNTLDIGPTSDTSVDGLPTTDNMIEFEDLILFGLNYGIDVTGRGGILSYPQVPDPASSNTMALHLPDLPGIGQTFQAALVMSGDGQIQGMSIPLNWAPGLIEPLAVQGGPLLAAQGGSSLVLSPVPGVIDVCLAGIRENGICGVGTLATVTFRVLASGNPNLQLADIDARDQSNQPVVITTTEATPVGEGGHLPMVSALHPNYPNPFNPMTTISFDLAISGRVRIDIFSLDGRRIRTLIDGAYTAGRHDEVWDGRDQGGRTVASGTYLFTLEGPNIKQSRRMLLIK